VQCLQIEGVKPELVIPEMVFSESKVLVHGINKEPVTGDDRQMVPCAGKSITGKRKAGYNRRYV